MVVRGPDEGEGVPAQAMGEVVAGRFEVRGHLGSGGMAEVLDVWDRHSARELALKVLRAEVARVPEAGERMRREARVLASIEHPAIVSVEAFGTLEDGRAYFAMERLRGETLGARMRRGPMTPAELVPVVAGLAEGLAAAHGRGVIHRDLKPDNVFLPESPHGGLRSIKILDFGVAKAFDYERLTQTGQVLGTPRYMAPEQLTADDDLDPRVDVYALGVILYEALAGQPPFVAQDPGELIVSVLHGRVVPLRALRVDLSPELETVVMGAMARDREARPPSVTELARRFSLHATEASPATQGGVPTSVMGTFEPPTAPRLEVPPSPGGPRQAQETPSPVEPGPSSGREASASPGDADPQEPLVPRGLESRRGPALVGASAGVLAALAVLWVTDGFGWFPSDPPATAVSEALQEARRAHAAGDGQRCADEVERAMDRGAPASALRLLGDCLWMEGDRAAAVDAYRRLCQLVPDHPAIAGARRRVESEGEGCP